MQSSSQEFPEVEMHWKQKRFQLRILALLVLLGAGLTGVLQFARTSELEKPLPARKADDRPLPEKHPVSIRRPTAPRIALGTVDEKGQPVSVTCATCHTSKPVNATAKLGVPLTMFHQNMVGAHGNLTCVSCHNSAAAFQSLRLADGTPVEYPEVMTLCAQCHGTHFRDYQHGAHGGMTGHWDLTRGGRQRNNCIHCHDPHSPKYPTVQPATGPHDRFQTGGGHE